MSPISLVRSSGCVIGLVVLGACAGSGPALDPAAIDTARVDGIQEEAFVLQDGSWEGAPFVEGGAARPRAGLLEGTIRTGSFTASGRDQAAALLWHSSGGSGTRTWLVVFEGGTPRPHSVAAALVGDRVQLVGLEVDGPAIVLDLIAHGPADAACCPGQHEQRRYRFDGATASVDTLDLGRATTAMLAGRSWRLDRFTLEQAAPVPVAITIEFDGEGRAWGNSGCNLYEATVEESDDKDLTIRAHPTTMRRCPEDKVAAESEFLRLLAGVSRFSFLNGQLALQYLAGDDAGVMLFDAAGPDRP